MNTMNNLPDKWDVRPLGEACKTIKGKKPKNSGPATTERTVPYINIKAFESGQPVEFAAPGNYPTCERDDVLIVWDGARAGLSGRAVPGYIGSTLAKVYSDVADNRYLFYFLQSQYGRINSRTKGVGIPHVDPTIFNNIPFPIAPPDQQKSIVAEIEKQFSRLDEAVANLKRVKANLKRYKAAVLKAAVEGRLVETEAELARREGRSYETGAQLLQRILETRRNQWKGKGKYKEPAAPDTTGLPELPEGWVWATVGELCLFDSGEAFKKRDYSADGLRLLQIANVGFGQVEWEQQNYLPMNFSNKFPELIMRPGDIVLALNRPIIGERLKVACVSEKDLPAILYQRVGRLRPVIGVSPSYLFSFFQSPAMLAAVRKRLQGTDQPYLNTSLVPEIAIPLPSAPEQQRIVAEIDRRFSLVRGTEAQVDANLKRSERMRQSILTRSFFDASK